MYKCGNCVNYFNEPLYVSESDVWYKDNKYTTRHCPYCSNEDIEPIFVLFEYDGKIYEDDEILMRELMVDGKSESEIEEIILNEVLEIRKWEE